MSEETKIDYQLKDIIDFKFSVDESENLFKLYDDDRITNINTQFIPLLDTSILVCSIGVKSFKEISDQENVFFHLIERFIFEIPKIKDYVEGDIINIPRDFLIILASISYSTTRGILHQKLHHYRYSVDSILPVLNPNNLIKEDFTLKIPKNVEPDSNEK